MEFSTKIVYMRVSIGTYNQDEWLDLSDSWIVISALVGDSIVYCHLFID